MRNLVIVCGILACAFLLGPVLERSNYNGLASDFHESKPPPTELPIASKVLPSRVLYDDTMEYFGAIQINAIHPFIVHITANCTSSRDMTDTYLDSFGPVQHSYDIKGASFNKVFYFPAGNYEFDIDNLCPSTHLKIIE